MWYSIGEKEPNFLILSYGRNINIENEITNINRKLKECITEIGDGKTLTRIGQLLVDMLVET